jgi:uncharacterized protein (TIGR00369 family)
LSNASPDALPALTSVSIPFLTWLGAEFVSAQAGLSEIRLVLQPHHHNSWDVSHGGVLMTLLDVAQATAARSMHPEAQGSATVEMKTTFVRPGTGSVLIARGKCYHRSTTMAFCEAEVVDEQGLLVAKATGTFKYIKRRSSLVRDA